MNHGELFEMTQRLVAFRSERNWEQYHNAKDQILSLNLEAAELLELTQWKNGDALQAHLSAHKEAVADELVDVLNWVLLIAHDQGIDLTEAFPKKLAKNAKKYPVDKVRGRADKYTAYEGET